MDAKGIDVSYFQGNVDWDKVSKNDIQFAMIRATYGSTGIDKMFSTNMEKIQKTNIAPGTYHYCYAMNPQEATKEANHFISIIKPYQFTYPAALDLEESSIAELGKQKVTDIILAFVDTLRKNNFYPILYVNLNWIKNYVDIGRISDLDIWLSEWGPQMNYTDKVTMWQYSSQGFVPGITSRVDLNISLKDYPTIIKDQGLNGTGSNDNQGNSENTNGSEPEEKPVLYVVKKGDSLWDIAEKFLGDGNRYREIMALNSLKSDVIRPGQILKIPQNNANEPVLYRVKRGDTLWEIAQKFLGDGKKYPQIVSLNGLTSDTIYPGQILKVPVDSENVTVPYTVKKGDTLWDISKRFLGSGQRYKDIMSLNNLSSDKIFPGQILKIPSK